MDNPLNEQQKREVKGKERGSKITKRKWTRKEDEALVAALLELCDTGWKRDNNNFKSGYTAVLEKELKSKLPGRDLKASPHIESRLKTLKKHCDAITDQRGAIGIQGNNEEHTAICEDDDVHSDAKGLKNKPFPYYDDLCIIFGKNRGSQKGVENALNAEKVLDGEEASNNPGNLMRTEGVKRKNRASCTGGKIESAGKELDFEEANNNAEILMGADGSNGNNRAYGEGVGNFCRAPDHEAANNHEENLMGADGSNDVDVSVDVVEGTHQMHMRGSTSSKNANKKRIRSGDSLSSGFGEVAKIFQTLLQKYDDQFSLLVGLVGREVAADKAAAEKRARLNGELKKIPNLSLQARLRAASLIVSDLPKLDLFFSFSDDERREWVSMLLSGLI